MSTLISILIVSCITSQQLKQATSHEDIEGRVAQIIKALEPDNSLRYSLERGARGDLVHHAWMEKMKKLGIKQASFRISFAWRGKIERLKIEKTSFLRRYYRFDSQIKDQQLLRDIKDSGVESELREAVLARAQRSVVELMKNQPSPAHGTLYLNLLDDDALPILDEMPDIKMVAWGAIQHALETESP